MEQFIIGIDGSVKSVNDSTKLEDLQRRCSSVEGERVIIERVTLSCGELWLDESGLLKGLPFNRTATIIARTVTGLEYKLFGPAVLRIKKGYKLVEIIVSDETKVYGVERVKREKKSA